MRQFLEKHADKIHGKLSCFDRLVLRGYLPLFNGYQMAEFLRSHGVRPSGLKPFLLAQAKRLTDHAWQVAEQAKRPMQYLGERARKEDLAREIAERDGITEGLVCVLSVLEPCRTFSLKWKEDRPFIQPAKRKCLHLYYYFIDRDFGLGHVKIQTWFPFRVQVYVNGHEWLARKLTRHGIAYAKVDNAFLEVDKLERAQRFADRFASLEWVGTLRRWAERVNPLLDELLAPMQYYWVIAQAEYSTDILFKRRDDLERLAPRLLEHATLCFGGRDVMTFLGRKLHGKFEGELVTDLREHELRGRLPGRRVKHRMKVNWIKMYDKAGSVLRIETVINEPEEFRVRRRVRRNGRQVMAWVPLRKSIAYLFRYRDVALESNSRYLNALAAVHDPTPALRALDGITVRKCTPSGRTVKPFNPLAATDRDLFRALLAGEHVIHGFTNRDLRAALYPAARGEDRLRVRAQVSRMLSRLHAYDLVAKIPRSRRWKVSAAGHRLMSASLKLREVDFPLHHDNAA